MLRAFQTARRLSSVKRQYPSSEIPQRLCPTTKKAASLFHMKSTIPTLETEMSSCRFVWLCIPNYLLASAVCKAKWRTEAITSAASSAKFASDYSFVRPENFAKLNFCCRSSGLLFSRSVQGSFEFCVSLLLKFSLYQFGVPQVLSLAAMHPRL